MDRELFEKNYMWLKNHANNQEGRPFSFADEGWVPSEEDCFGIEVKGRYWNLCSAYDMEIPVSAWLEQECLQSVEYNSTMVMFGFGNPNYLANLVESFPQNSVIVIEPAERVIQAWTWVIDFEELFSKAEIIFLIGPLRQLRLMNYL